MDNLKLRPIEDEDIGLIKMWQNKDYIKKWYNNPEDWIEEINKRNNEFIFIHHFIVEHNHKPIGFCQYYDCFYAEEDWYEVRYKNHSFSIDYFIGEGEYLGKGYGTAIVELLTETIKIGENAKRIIVKPDKANLASNKTLISAGYMYDEKYHYYVYSN